MSGSWTEYAVLWTNYLGFIWDILNFLRSVNPERKFDVQNSYFGGGYVFRIGFFKLLNNDDSDMPFTKKGMSESQRYLKSCV